jgi:hypothetical protein
MLAHVAADHQHSGLSPDPWIWWVTGVLLVACAYLVAQLVQRRRHGADAELSRGTRIVAGLAVGALLVGACSDSDSSSDSTTTGGESTSSSAPTTTDADERALDLTALPLGDDRYTDAPEAGYVFTCQTTFEGGGAFTQGPWIDAGAGTWNMLDKVEVEGDVDWPDAMWDDALDGDTRTLSSVDLPVDHTTGEFPVAADSDAYQYDRNPNSIAAHETSLSVPRQPVVLDEPECVGGEVGIMTTGVLIFSAFDAGGRDAVATEVQDHCQGHPQAGSYYHYHGPSSCVEEIGTRAPDGEHSDLQGYAYDGFGIFGVYGEGGALLSSNDLDECHGHTHEIEWDSETVELYHYHFTPDFPYTVGCFRAEPQVQGLSQGEERVAPDGGGAPPGAP